MRARLRKLSSQIFLAQLVILVAAMTIGFVLSIHAESGRLDAHYESRAAGVAWTVAAVPSVRSCVAVPTPACQAELRAFATATQSQTGAAYVVVLNLDRIRLTHPDPREIGKPVSEPLVTRDGKVHYRIDDGTPGSTGRSANARVPLYGPSGAMVGAVSVGFFESSVSQALWNEIPSYVGWFLIALAIGALAAWLLARRLKSRTFGLELDEIARLLQEREATLHGIREGVIAFDPAGRISVVNDEARRLLALPDDSVRRFAVEVLPPGRLRDLLSGSAPVEDEIVFTDDFCLVISRRPVVLRGRRHGSVATLRDRTEIEALMLELDGERSLTDSLRAQQHEFANRLHAIAGMIELGETQAALAYVTEVRGTAAEFDTTLRTQIGAPQIVGLLLGKAAEAGERGVELRITPDTWVGDAPDGVQSVTTVLGNLIDNALDALATRPAPRLVEVEIIEDPGTTTIRVSDNGPGIPNANRELIFQDGWTTKPMGSPRGGGLGLALVQRLVIRLGGSIDIADGPGAAFTVQLPRNTDRQPTRAVRATAPGSAQ